MWVIVCHEDYRNVWRWYCSQGLNCKCSVYDKCYTYSCVLCKWQCSLIYKQYLWERIQFLWVHIISGHCLPFFYIVSSSDSCMLFFSFLMVVLQPQWLVIRLSRVIRCFCKHDDCKVVFVWNDFIKIKYTTYGILLCFVEHYFALSCDFLIWQWHVHAWMIFCIVYCVLIKVNFMKWHIH